MKKLFTCLLVLVSLTSFAEDLQLEDEFEPIRPTCEIKAGSWTQAANKGMKFSNEMTKEECMAIGKDLFNSPANVGWNAINPLKNTRTVTAYETQYKKVKATYFAEDGVESSKLFKRNDVYKILKSKVIQHLESGYKCWTKDECTVLSETVVK